MIAGDSPASGLLEDQDYVAPHAVALLHHVEAGDLRTAAGRFEERWSRSWFFANSMRNPQLLLSVRAHTEQPGS
jgi:hypothetical protein